MTIRTAGPEPAGATTTWLQSHPAPSGIDDPFLDRLLRHTTTPASARAPIEVRVPFTLDLLGRVPRGIPADVEAAAARARRAQAEWSLRPVSERARVLLRYHDLVLARRAQAIDLIQLETGKARRDAFEEVLDVARVARHYAVHGGRLLRPRRRRALLPLVTVAREHRLPVGVVGFIAPWNFPLVLSITDALAAVIAGNAGVLIPDVQSSFTALWAAALLYEAGLPRDVLCVVTGAGEELGTALIENVDFLMFTGSTRTGRIVAEQAARRLIGFSLELGGKNPMIVLEDADLDAAVTGAVRGAFLGSGQACVSIERILVHTSLHDRFVERFTQRVRAMKLSPALEYGVDMGSLTALRQLESVEAHVRDALDRGASLLAGGRRREDLGPLFYEPTVLTAVTPEMRAYAEETFGPVVSVYRFDTIDEAVALANDTAYGLSASIWSRDMDRAQALARRIRAGAVNVNEAYGSTWGSTGAPIGGMKESGLGRRHGEEGLLKYTEAQTIAIQRWLAFSPPRFMSEHGFLRALHRLWRVIRRLPGIR